MKTELGSTTSAAGITSAEGPRAGAAGSVLRLVVAVFALALAPLGYWALIDDTSRGAMIFVGVVCLLAIGFPLFIRGRGLSPLEPIVLCTLAVAIGCTFRTIYIGFSDNYRASFVTFGQSYSQIANGGVWVALALTCLSVGYLVTTAKIDLGRADVGSARSVQVGGRFWLVALVSIVLAILSTYIFVDLFDVGLSADSISKKRLLDITETGQEGSTSALGPVRVLGGFAESVLYVLVGAKLLRRERWGGPYFVLAILLFTASAILPFITSSRSALGVILINCIALLYLAGRLRIGQLLVAVVLISIVVPVMGDLRSNGRESDAGSTAIDAIVGSGNFVDLARTTAILDRVPDEVAYENGRTYAALITAPIPSSAWPGKPAVSLGPYVKTEIFGQRTVAGGWPPGILGEAAINLGIPGMLTIGFLFGAMLRLVYNSFEPFLRTNLAAAVIYVTIFWPLGLQFIGSSFANGVMRTLTAAVPTLIILLAVRGRVPKLASGRARHQRSAAV